MKRIITLFTLSILSLFANESILMDFSVSTQYKNVHHLVQTYLHVNHQIKGLKENYDQNSSLHDEILSELEKNKKSILSKISDAVAKEKVDDKIIENFSTKRQKLLDKQKKNMDKAYAYIDTSLDIIYLDAQKKFYSSLFELKKKFKKTDNGDGIILMLDQTINDLRNLLSFDLSTYRTKIDHFELEKVSNKQEFIFHSIDSYVEILQYLRMDSHLLRNNYVFSLLELQIWIDRINDRIGINYINVGKIVISALVLIFFMSLRRFFSNIVYFILVRMIYRNRTNLKNIKFVFIKNIKKPIGFLLVFYAISLCLTIAIYPAPLNVNVRNFFSIAYAILIAWLILGMLDGYGVILISKLAQRSEKKEIINFIIKILYFVVFIITLLYILVQLGFNISAIIASLGIGGLAIALATKDIIANFFASILLLFDNSFNQGDWVEIDGVEGTIVETGLRKTTIRTFDNSLVFLPNSAIMGANIKNWSKRRMGRHVRMFLGVGYDATPEKLKNCVKDLKEFLDTSALVAHEDDGALKYGDHIAKYRQNLVSINDLEGYKNACYVALNEFGDSSINIELYFYTKAIGGKEFRDARQELMLEFMRIIEKNGLSFAFPSRSVYIENLPPLHLKKKDISE